MKSQIFVKTTMTCTLVFFVSACGTMRVNYKTSVETPAGQKGTYQLKKSYEIGGSYKTLCTVTAIFLGGSCWFYLAMPTVNQEKQVETDARESLAKELKTDKFTLKNPHVDVESWSEEPVVSKLTLDEGSK